ncbi:hypothetical protein IE81DRAFT_44925 [Ceraceosorus guamensis]|uniref:Uncharacterized protein n=1 Tax=Ceraceosorus guamensis TaxID=1522189 RepID=A0A316W2U9_9BASI|nr:hypothetical protein IE81DRAFT_44925 [Ceraceosorus guamensis]PWN44042.1 hypothetical protein IE81DRAFT_44925 [Ceraceosorus guamensis]
MRYIATSFVLRLSASGHPSRGESVHHILCLQRHLFSVSMSRRNVLVWERCSTRVAAGHTFQTRVGEILIGFMERDLGELAFLGFTDLSSERRLY